MEEAAAAAGGAAPPTFSLAPRERGSRKRRLSSSGVGGPAAAMMPFGPVDAGVFDRVASRRLQPQGSEWVLEAEGIQAYLPSLLRLLRDADESKVRIVCSCVCR